MSRLSRTLFSLILFILLALAALPASAQSQEGDKLCYSPANSSVNVPACFPKSSYFDLPVGVFRSEQGQNVPVSGMPVEFLHVNFDISYSIASCVTNAAGQCSLRVPEHVVGTLVMGAERAAQLGIDPVGYAGVFAARHEKLQEALDKGQYIEDVFDSLYPYELKTTMGERAMLVIAPSPEDSASPYPNHWVLYSQEQPQEPFLRNPMGEFAPSAQTLPPAYQGGEQSLTPMPTATLETGTSGEEAAPQPVEKAGFPLWMVIVVVCLAAAILLIVVRVRLLLREQ